MIDLSSGIVVTDHLWKNPLSPNQESLTLRELKSPAGITSRALVLFVPRCAAVELDGSVTDAGSTANQIIFAEFLRPPPMCNWRLNSQKFDFVTILEQPICQVSL